MSKHYAALFCELLWNPPCTNIMEVECVVDDFTAESSLICSCFATRLSSCVPFSKCRWLPLSFFVSDTCMGIFYHAHPFICTSLQHNSVTILCWCLVNLATYTFSPQESNCCTLLLISISGKQSSHIDGTSGESQIRHYNNIEVPCLHIQCWDQLQSKMWAFCGFLLTYWWIKYHIDCSLVWSWHVATIVSIWTCDESIKIVGAFCVVCGVLFW
jgi:hypothetical protein